MKIKSFEEFVNEDDQYFDVTGTVSIDGEEKEYSKTIKASSEDAAESSMISYLERKAEDDGSPNSATVTDISPGTEPDNN